MITGWTIPANSEKLSFLSAPPTFINKIVANTTLKIFDNFLPQYHQLQKNVLLTICNDRILQEVSFDKYRCARLVLDCLCAWHESSMNRMSVAICSILGEFSTFPPFGPYFRTMMLEDVTGSPYAPAKSMQVFIIHSFNCNNKCPFIALVVWPFHLVVWSKDFFLVCKVGQSQTRMHQRYTPQLSKS